MEKWKVKQLMEKYPGRVPVILKNFQTQDEIKRLVNEDMTVALFISIMHKTNQLKQNESIFIFTENKSLVPFTESIKHVYEQHKNTDEILILTYSYENVFGCD